MVSKLYPLSSVWWSLSPPMPLSMLDLYSLFSTLTIENYWEPASQCLFWSFFLSFTIPKFPLYCYSWWDLGWLSCHLSAISHLLQTTFSLKFTSPALLSVPLFLFGLSMTLWCTYDERCERSWIFVITFYFQPSLLHQAIEVSMYQAMEL